MELVIENVLENLQLHLEHDSGYPPDWDVLPDKPEYENYIENARNQILVFNGADDKPIEGAYYVTVDEAYPWNFSPGQQTLYELLLSIQKGSLYAITTVGQLADAMDLKVIWAAYQRLDNLQALKAISGVER
mgnify:FL=1